MADKKKGVKSRLKYIYRRIDSRIIDFISGRNARQKRRIVHAHPAISGYEEATDLEALLKLARRYDIEEFFIMKIKMPVRKLNFFRRTLLRVYQKTRDVSIDMIKSAYHLWGLR